MGETLFLAHRVPWPPNRGDKIRSHHILQKLMDGGTVHMACFADDEPEKQAGWSRKAELGSCKIVLRAKPQWLAGIEAVRSGQPVSVVAFEDAEIRAFVLQLIASRPIDRIFVFSGQMAQYIPPEFAGQLIMDFADVDSAKFESYAEEGHGPMAWIHRREGRLLKRFEADVARRADYSLFVSEAEAALFRRRSGLSGQHVRAIGNGIDLDFYDPDAVEPAQIDGDGPLILFTGQMDYPPNVQAVASFSRTVMPAICQQYPDARFAIVGRAPTHGVRQLDGTNGTMVIGAVEDIRSWIQAADIIVAPLRIARGIQNKVLEAMAMAKPVVASQCAANGIDAVEGKHFLVAGSHEEEAEFVCDLLDDPQRAKSLGEQARRLIQTNYSWDRQLSVLDSLSDAAGQQAAEAAA